MDVSASSKGTALRVSVILPAYNEVETIEEVAERSLQALRARDAEAEIWIIDDGSTDGTAERAQALAQKTPEVHVVHHRRNRGLTSSLLEGFRAATGDYVVFLCADMQSDPLTDIPALLDLLDEGADVALGWRQHRHESKIVVSKIYHILCRLFFGLRLHDMNWIKAFRREVVESLHLRADWHRYIPVLAAAEGFKIAEVPVAYHPRRYGRSKFGVRRILPGFFDLLSIRFLLSFSRRPMHFFGTMGLLWIAVALALGAYGVTRFCWTWGDYKPYTITYVIFFTSFFGGLLLLAIGFLGELLANLQDSIDALREER